MFSRMFSASSFLVMFLAIPLSASVLYVDDDATPGGDGLTWETAYDDLQLALDAAKEPGSGVTEIRIAAGTYVPTPYRSSSFQLINGVTVRGGHRGCPAGDCTGGDPGEWNLDLYETTLSGDRFGDDGPGFTNYDENCYHVFFHPAELALDETAVLDGCVISGGNANYGTDGDLPHDMGGGMYNQGCSPTIMNCTIRDNRAYANAMGYPGYGGGIAGVGGSHLTLLGCTIAGNRARQYGGGAYFTGGSCITVTDCVLADNVVDPDTHWTSGVGGGMYCLYGSSLVMKRSTIIGNYASDSSAGVCVFQSDAIIRDCVFVENHSDGGGGGVVLSSCHLTMTGCTIMNNYAYDGGSGVSWSAPLWRFSAHSEFLVGQGERGDPCELPTTGIEPMMSNCIVAHNTTRPGCSSCVGGVACYSIGFMGVQGCTIAHNDGIGLRGSGERVFVENCILWANAETQLTGSSVFAEFSCVEGGYVGYGNIDLDPRLVDPDGPDNDPTTWQDNNFQIQAGSACIDAGDSTLVPLDILDLDEDGDTGESLPIDFGGRQRFVDDPETEDTGIWYPHVHPATVDIGAYEFQALPNDCNDNGIPDDEDIASGFSQDCDGNGTPDECELCGDLNDDGSVDYDDYTIFLTAFGGVVDGAPPEDACCDADDSGDIGMADYAAWLACYRDFIQDPLAGPPTAPADEGFAGQEKGDTRPDRKAHRPRPRAVDATEIGAGRTPRTDRAASRRR